MTAPAAYRFFPWVREGYRPSTEDNLNETINEAAALDVLVTLTGEGDGSTDDDISTRLRLYGPGEVVGIDHRQVVKTTPTAGATDFLPNRFATVEFDESSLPWLFSPAAGNSDGALRPWLCLVTVERQEGVEITFDKRRPLPTLQIASPAVPARELPDLAEAHAWAHAQLIGDFAEKDPDDPESVRDDPAAMFGRQSDRSVSRLVSPRYLDANTPYYACVVPVFRPGVLAGLGRDQEPESESDSVEMAVAWRMGSMPGNIELPVYYHWEFTTGAAGDFEALVDALDPLDPNEVSSVGIRRIDASDPGYERLASAPDVGPIEVDVEGALRSPMIDPLAYPASKRTELESLLNRSSALQPETGWPSESGRPILGPPIYGQWPPGAVTIPENLDGSGGPAWLRELNLDPRYRVPAGFGTQIVRDQQESLMASAWDQVGEIRRANELVNRARLSREAEAPVYRQLEGLPRSELLRFTSPTHQRIQRLTPEGEPPVTIGGSLLESSLRPAALSPAFRRISRPSGPLARRFERQGQSLDTMEITDQFANGDVQVPTERSGMGTFEEVSEAVCQSATQHEVELATDREEWSERFETDPSEQSQLLVEACESLEEIMEEEALQSPDLDAETQESIQKLSNTVEELCSAARRIPEFVSHDAYAQIINRVRQIIAALDSAEATIDDLRNRINNQDPNSLNDLLKEILEELDEAVEEFTDEFNLLFYLILPPLLKELCGTITENRVALLKEIRSADASDEVYESADRLETLCSILCGDPMEPEPSEAPTLVDRFEETLSARTLERVDALLRSTIWITKIGRETIETLTRLGENTGWGRTGGSHLDNLRDRCMVFATFLTHLLEILADAPSDPRAELADVVCPDPDQSPPRADLVGIGTDVLGALDPEKTICQRVRYQIGGAFDVASAARDDCLDIILMSPEFPQPMYLALKDLSQEYLMPGISDLPNDSISVLETNPAFIESYMLGLNHEMARELQWREYPTDRRGTYFRQFWDVRGHVPEPTTEEDIEVLRDIDPIHQWLDTNELGESILTKLSARPNVSGGGSGSETGEPEGTVVLVVRGRLLDRYPNTMIYAAKARAKANGREPMLPDPENDDAGSVEFPIFRGRLDPDITFFGFDISPTDAVSEPGWFFVFEEPPGEPSFGLDVSVDRETESAVPDEWVDLTWKDVLVDSSPYARIGPLNDVSLEYEENDQYPPLTWGKNGAHMAKITWQRPVRVAIHADDMLPVSTEGDT